MFGLFSLLPEPLPVYPDYSLQSEGILLSIFCRLLPAPLGYRWLDDLGNLAKKRCLTLELNTQVADPRCFCLFLLEKVLSSYRKNLHDSFRTDPWYWLRHMGLYKTKGYRYLPVCVDIVRL